MGHSVARHLRLDLDAYDATIRRFIPDYATMLEVTAAEVAFGVAAAFSSAFSSSAFTAAASIAAATSAATRASADGDEVYTYVCDEYSLRHLLELYS